MANPEQLKILRRDVEEWSEWRRKHSEVQLDLVGADLAGAHLRGAILDCAILTGSNLAAAHLETANLESSNLSNAHLKGAYLEDANLEGANLMGANLESANLSGTNLGFANLTRANLGFANLSDTNLTRAELSANLECVNLAGARLNGTNFTDATVGYAAFLNIDLRPVQGLESVWYVGPSSISTDTLMRSHGQLPRAFLKGCGLTDWEIENARLWDPNLTNDEITTTLYEINRLRGEQPINPFRVFISYTRNKDKNGRSDEPFAEALEKHFDEKGMRYWRDVHDLKAGRLERQIDHAIDLNPLVLLVLSERSVESDWVEWEAAKARKVEKELGRDVLCPVTLDDAWKTCAWPGPLRRQIADYHILDFSGWQDAVTLERQFAKLLDGLKLFYRH